MWLTSNIPNISPGMILADKEVQLFSLPETILKTCHQTGSLRSVARNLLKEKTVQSQYCRTT
ncbi:MAG: hypothetical protein DRH50_12560 [Deltaproteobacteria bacterium]|nr:MAG: hypothetical protein DRH50_12560 [Deltaproteobacteria bacterium]